MIIGIGVDIIEIQRFQRSISRYGDRFLRKIFTEQEVRYYQKEQFPARHFAAGFSAKEALSKALATGYSGEFEWHNVEVIHNAQGKPCFTFHNATAQTLSGLTVSLSISYSDSFVTAFVIIAHQ